MISPQFIEFIKHQLAAGIAREDIRKALVINGLSEQEIAEGFATAAPLVASAPVPAPAAAQAAPIVAQAVTAAAPVVSIWAKGIPRTNWFFMVVSLILVFGLDLAILIGNPSLSPFWIEMLIVFSAFVIFFYLENYVFSKKFSSTKSAMDPWISAIIVVRNLVFVLNFIPLIQIVGMMMLTGFLTLLPSVMFGGFGRVGNLFSFGGLALAMPALFVLYIVLIWMRYSAARQR